MLKMVGHFHKTDPIQKPAALACSVPRRYCVRWGINNEHLGFAIFAPFIGRKVSKESRVDCVDVGVEVAVCGEQQHEFCVGSSAG